MKNPAILILVFLSVEANAGHECTASVFSKGKTVSESKLEMKSDKKNKNLTSAEKDGYAFELVRNDTDPNQVEKLIVTEKASTRRSVSSFAGLKGDNPNAIFTTALLEDVGGPTVATGARITCKIKP